MRNDLNKGKEGNRVFFGLATSLSYPLENLVIDTAFFCRCKGFTRSWQGVLLAEAFDVSPL
jgi:hypothetical protein